MAIFRENPKCLKCGGIINGIYLDQSNVSSHLQVYGDSFLNWDYAGHVCEKEKVDLTEEDPEFYENHSREEIIALLIEGIQLIKETHENYSLQKKWWK